VLLWTGVHPDSAAEREMITAIGATLDSVLWVETGHQIVEGCKEEDGRPVGDGRRQVEDDHRVATDLRSVVDPRSAVAEGMACFSSAILVVRVVKFPALSMTSKLLKLVSSESLMKRNCWYDRL